MTNLSNLADIVNDETDERSTSTKHLSGYLTHLGLKPTVNVGDERTTVIIDRCDNEDHAKQYKSYFTVFDDGNIAHACHAAKCEGFGWADFQEKVGLSFTDFLKEKGLKKPGKRKKEKRSDQSEVMIQQAQDTGDVFIVDEKDGKPYALTTRRGVKEAVPIESKAYGNILRLRYRAAGSGTAKREWVRNAQEELSAIASEQGEEQHVCIRTGHYQGHIYIDVCDKERNVLDIGPEGWRVITTDDCPLIFKRGKAMKALPSRSRAARSTI